MTVFKYIRISFAHAYYGNPNVGQGTIDLKEGEGHKSKGFEVSSDHRFLTAWAYDPDENYPMRCEVGLRPGFFTQVVNFLKGNPMYRTRPKYITVNKPKRFKLAQVDTVMFNNDWDDSCYSFYNADKLFSKEKK